MPYEEFIRIEELLADLEDLRDLREAKQSEAQLPTVTLEEVKRRLGRS
ncbi:MAG: type II toxin-antitoxin system Phd/YefM family antitoxin [Hormoscilla sp. GM102CHS1]|nr:type II toxin-antitoxin system Phd/YefM family antitoxin [Hormoscilla sp. GM102CHS1]